MSGSVVALQNYSDTTVYVQGYTVVNGMPKRGDTVTLFKNGGNKAFENNVPGLGRGGTNQNASWYSFGNWFLYQFNEKLTGVWRSEIFRDNNGIRTGFADNFYEMTLGGIYKPRSWFWLRPEVRWDWTPGTPVYDDGQSRHQFTFGFDAIFLF